MVHLFKLKNPNSRLTRLRVDLEEFDFTVEHISGKSNVIADALSRITIKELKALQGDDKFVYVMTRSKTKNQKLAEVEEKVTEVEKLKVYEEINRSIDRATPELKSINDELCAIKRNKKLIFAIDIANLIANDTIQLEKLLSTLEIGAKENNKIKIEKFRIEMGDPIFKKYKIEDFKRIGNKVLKNTEIVIYKAPTEIIENDEKIEIMKKYHENKIVGGHCGSKKLFAKVRDLYYWKNMTKDIARFVKNCELCLLNKPKTKTKQELKPLEIPQKSFDVIVVDTIGPLMTSNSGNKYAVTIMCALTKYLVCIPVRDKTANSIARAIIDHFVLHYGTFAKIITDLGTEYKNTIFSELAKTLNFEQSFSTAYHHETVGLIERNHRTFNQYLRIYLRETLGDWDEFLKYFCFCYNNNPHASFDEKFTPFELIFGKRTQLSEKITGSIQPIYNIEDYSKEFAFRMQKSHEIARKLLLEYKQKMKINFDKNTRPLFLQINDKILIKREPYDKFKQVYDGPFKIIQINEPNVIYIDNNNKTKEIHKNRIIKA